MIHYPDPIIFLGIIFSCSSAALVGTFNLFQRKALASDAVAHALLPGLCLGFMWAGERSPFHFITGAFVTGSLALLLIDYLPAYTKLKRDTATAVVSAIFFGVGTLFLTRIQRSWPQAGLKHFLWGDPAALRERDIKIFAILGLMVVITTITLFRSLRLLVFDRSFAIAIGWPVFWLDLLLRAFTVLAIVIGVQTIGIVLMTAMMITPAMGARFWSKHLATMLGIAVLLGVVPSMVGTLLSHTARGLPTGPCAVLMMTCAAFVSFLFGSERGWVMRRYAKHAYQQKILCENVLKIFYELAGPTQTYDQARSLEVLLAHRSIPRNKMVAALRKLCNQGWVTQHSKDVWGLTPKGQDKAGRVYRLHILWEQYLVRYLGIQPDHVHDDAELMEHLLTPELEADLEKLLNDK